MDYSCDKFRPCSGTQGIDEARLGYCELPANSDSYAPDDALPPAELLSGAQIGIRCVASKDHTKRVHSGSSQVDKGVFEKLGEQ